MQSVTHKFREYIKHILQNVFIPKDRETYEELSKRFLSIMCFSTFVIASIIALVVVIGDYFSIIGTAADRLTMYLGLGLFFTSLIATYLVRKYVHHKIASFLFLIFIIVIISVADTPYEVVEGRTTFMFAIPIISASFLLWPSASYLFAFFGSISISIIGIRVLDIIPPIPIMAGFFVLATISWLIARNLKLTMNKLQKSATHLKKTKGRLELSLKGGSQGIFDVDLTKNKLYLNKQGAIILGISKKAVQLDLEEVSDMLSPINHDKLVQSMLSYLERGSDLFKSETKIVTNRGKTKWIYLAGKVISFDEKGEPKRVTGTFTDITDYKENEEWKNLLFNILNQDISNNIQLLHGYLDILKDTEMDDVQMNMLYKGMESIRNSEELLEKVNIIREIESDSTQGSINPFFLLKYILEKRKNYAKKKGITIQEDITETDSKVKSDQRGGILLEVVYDNIIENAIEHANCSLIRVITRETNPYVIVSIEDNGEGITDFQKIWIEKSDIFDERETSSALGLRLVKEILERLDGKMMIEDSDLGGAKVNIYLKKEK